MSQQLSLKIFEESISQAETLPGMAYFTDYPH